MPFLGKFSPKIKNCQFKLKFGTKTDSNMKDSKVMIILSVFNRKHPFFGQVLCEKSNSLLKMKVSSKTNSNLWNSVVILCLFSFLYQKNILFGLILSKISKFAIFVEIWYVDYFEYVKIDSGGHFSVLDLFLQVLSEKCIRHLDVTFLILISK